MSIAISSRKDIQRRLTGGKESRVCQESGLCRVVGDEGEAFNHERIVPERAVRVEVPDADENVGVMGVDAFQLAMEVRADETDARASVHAGIEVCGGAGTGAELKESGPMSRIIVAGDFPPQVADPDNLAVDLFRRKIAEGRLLKAGQLDGFGADGILEAESFRRSIADKERPPADGEAANDDESQEGKGHRKRGPPFVCHG